jgi:NTE family protein
MKAYAILDGGGVKGAALAGCLAAAEEHGVNFVGYGGTSAGSIVAALAAVGYDGNTIRNLLKSTIPPKALLDDDGAALSKVKEYPDEFMQIITANTWGITKCWNLKAFVAKASRDLDSINKYGGLYDGQKLKANLLALIKEGTKKYRKVDLDQKQDISFQDLKSAGCTPLKIVASDITRRRAAPYSVRDRDYSGSVIEAIRASACYPFLFKPVTYAGGSKVVDGGLASNLPIFLFAEEQEQTRYPILAFDLVSNAHPISSNVLVQLAKDLLDTGLEASDALILDLVPGVQHVPVEVPEGIDTLNFDLTDDDIDRLFAAGHQATSRYLQKNERLKLSKLAGQELPRQLQAIYGDQKLFEPVLWAVASMIQERTKAKEVRSLIMLPTGRPTNSRIGVYHHGFRTGDADSILELKEDGGCTGASIRNRQPVVADLEDARKNFATWGMTQLEQNQVAADRKSMISTPIFASSIGPTQEESALYVLGTLSIDSSTPLVDTDWVEPGWSLDEPQNKIKPQVLWIMTTWAAIVGELLRSQE